MLLTISLRALLAILAFILIVILLIMSIRSSNKARHFRNPPLNTDDVGFINLEIEKDEPIVSELTEDDSKFIKEYLDEMNKL